MAESSAVAQHISQNSSHQINFNAAVIIETEQKYFSRIFKEGLYINAEKTEMNQKDAMKINPIWTSSLLNL